MIICLMLHNLLDDDDIKEQTIPEEKEIQAVRDFIIDLFERPSFIHMSVPCHKKIEAQHTAQLLSNHVFRLHPYPRTILSVRDSIFLSDIWVSFLVREARGFSASSLGTSLPILLYQTRQCLKECQEKLKQFD
ncbi:hypothetical protein ACTFIW_012119 [Dictyostelium discoideum]